MVPCLTKPTFKCSLHAREVCLHENSPLTRFTPVSVDLGLEPSRGWSWYLPSDPQSLPVHGKEASIKPAIPEKGAGPLGADAHPFSVRV